MPSDQLSLEVAMLDYEYPSLRAFVRACRAARAYMLSGLHQVTYVDSNAMEYVARDLLISKQYVIHSSGRVIAREFI